MRQYTVTKPFEGVVRNLQRRWEETDSAWVREEMSRYQAEKPCATCNGARLKPEALAVKVAERNIAEASDQSIRHALSWFQSVLATLTPQRQEIARRILREIVERLQFLVDVGLDYLTLARGSATLSGGESQRIRLASQIGSGLTGVLYVLDEPSIGLHQRDNERLLVTLKRLNVARQHRAGGGARRGSDPRRRPRRSTWGPPPASTAAASWRRARRPRSPANTASLTGDYLSGRRRIEVPPMRRPVQKDRVVRVIGARGNNLKNLTAGFPLGTFTCVTGVSGGGKSTLVVDTLYKAASRRLMGSGEVPAPHAPHRGPGTTSTRSSTSTSRRSAARRAAIRPPTPTCSPRSATGSPNCRKAARAATSPAASSFNVKGGRCEACQGDGLLKIEMHFLPDVYVTCDTCKGRRYNRETLEMKFRGKSIADVLAMTVDEAVPFFSRRFPHSRPAEEFSRRSGWATSRSASRRRRCPAARRSGSSCRRNSARRATGRTLYILDEPTTGLHFEDVRKLLEVLHALVDHGNTVVVIEHNLEVIKTADWILDLGPEGGDGGGRIVAEGTPEDIAASPESHTGRFLAPLLPAGREKQRRRA